MMARPPARPAGPPPIHTPGSGEALLGQVAIAAILGVGTAGFVTWTGAQFAAIAFGDGPMPVGIADGGQAALSLASHADDPAMAWPEAVRPVLPGPIAYWVCSALVAAIALALAGVAVWTWVRWSRRGAHPLGVQPNAGFARPADIKKLIVGEPQPGRLTLGHLGRQLVAAEPQVSLAVVGPTGCGKTVGFAIPALLEWKGPIIATSVKNDLLDAALAHRAQRGTVWVYDPTSTSGRPAAKWSPLAACDTWAGAMRIAAWLCEAAQPRTDTVNDGDYWYTQARKALAPYLHAAARGDKNMRDVVRWIDTQEQDEVTLILRTSTGVHDLLDEFLASNRATERHGALEPEVTAAEIAAVREQLVSLGGGGPRSWEMQEFGSWPLEQQAQLKERVTKTIKQQLLAEFSEEAVAGIRKTGALDALIAAEALWNKEQRLRGSVFATVENVLNNHRAKLFGTGIADEATLEYVSRLIGDERRTEINMSGDLHGGRRSISEHINYRRAAPADLLRRIKTNEAILVYGSELPAHVRLRPWYE